MVYVRRGIGNFAMAMLPMTVYQPWGGVFSKVIKRVWSGHMPKPVHAFTGYEWNFMKTTILVINNGRWPE